MTRKTAPEKAIKTTKKTATIKVLKPFVYNGVLYRKDFSNDGIFDKCDINKLSELGLVQC